MTKHTIPKILNEHPVYYYKFNSQEMGNTSHDKKAEMPFIEHIEESIFGPIDLYQNQDGVYVMQIRKTYVKDDINHKTMRQITQYALETHHNYIIPIVSIKTDDHHGICGISSTFILRTEYYNFTLHDMINSKKVFDEGELWLIFEAILSLILDLKNNNLTMKLQGNRIFLTLKGQPAISHLHIQSNENSLSFHFATMGQYLAKLMIEIILGKIIPQEYLEQANKQMKHYLEEVDKRYKKMHGFIKSLLFNDRKERDVMIEISQLIHSGKVKKATQIKLTKHKYLIPESIPRREEKVEKQDIVTNSSNKVVNSEFFRSANEDSAMFTGNKQRKRTEYTDDKSETNKEYHSSSQFFMTEKTNILNLESSKIESSKLLGEFEKKKEQYRLQKQKFEQKRNQLLYESEKENIQNSRPSMREFQSKKLKNKVKTQELKRVPTETGKNSRYR